MRIDPSSEYVATTELIIGGQKSGKSARAEHLAQTWLQQNPAHQVKVIVTGQAFDAEMQQRIARHQIARAQRLPGVQTLEVPLSLVQTLEQHSQPHTLLVVDCLTLWLTNWLMPAQGDAVSLSDVPIASLCQAVSNLPGPVVLVSNEIGWGVIPLGTHVRAFVDGMGLLNQQVARVCQRVTLMAAGLPLVVKGSK
jgi:adenosylcobinamide kinase/adenosylcobinamide-phosphate guanylyltransferase